MSNFGFTTEQVSKMDQIIARYPRSRSAIMPLLHFVQSIYGYVTYEGIEFIGKKLDLATAEVNAVASFYTQYKRKPVGEYHIGVCTNTLCAVMGGDAIYSALQDQMGLDHDGVSADGKSFWVSGRYDDAIYQISLDDGHLIKKIKTDKGPHGLAVWPQPGRYSLGHSGIMR